ncbi:MAG: dihydrodipicolinate synthase family protein [Gemmatimonadota bacterium]|nr:dihydrodipicolinate synthase family protein [Gemmatimonadota bacterium]MEC9317322.1 dihydrodipicolinate synthase family protein [Gemmatimonadota bacterium]
MAHEESVNLAGTFLPVTTPFDPVTGDVDYVAFGNNLRMWFGSPIRGILIGGSTGESVFLDERERSKLIEEARSVIPDEALVIAGTGSEATRHTIQLTQQAAAAGADAALVSPPAYFKGAMTKEALTSHYRAVADASPVPVLIYQVPLRLSTIEFSTGLVATLSDHPNIIGIKDSRGEIDLLVELVQQSADGFQVLTGNGSVLYPALGIGAVGGIVAVGLMAADQAAKISVAFREGRLEEAERLQGQIAFVNQSIVGGMGVPGIKAALDLLGFSGGVPRPPLAPVSELGIEEVKGILETADLLECVGV